MVFSHKAALEKAFSDLKFDGEDNSRFTALFGTSSTTDDLRLQGLLAILQLSIYSTFVNQSYVPSSESDKFAIYLTNKLKFRFGKAWDLKVRSAIAEIKEFLQAPMV